jgi:glutamate synthase domain-containing protein 2
VKQVASARFGVTPRYLKRAEGLGVKIAQGSSPAKAGSCCIKSRASSLACATRSPAQLISPPPHRRLLIETWPS